MRRRLFFRKEWSCWRLGSVRITYSGRRAGWALNISAKAIHPASSQYFNLNPSFPTYLYTSHRHIEIFDADIIRWSVEKNRYTRTSHREGVENRYSTKSPVIQTLASWSRKVKTAPE